MQEIIRIFLFYISGIWRYRWYVLVLAAVISPVGWAFVASLPDEYEASARVYVDTDSVLTPLLSGLAIRTDDGRRIRMMTNVLFSRENMEKLARMTDMDLRAKTPEEMDALIADLKDRVKLALAGAENIYRISFKDESPDLAKRVVQSMLTIFVESNLGSSRQDQDSAERFLQREIKDYERRLIESERKLKDFQMRNLDLLSEKGSHYEQLKRAKDELLAASEGLTVARSRRDELQTQLEYLESEGANLPGFQTWVEDAAKTVTNPLDAKVAEMEAQIEELLIRYTELHPEIIAMRRALARLERERDAQQAQYVAEQRENPTAVTRSLMENPVYNELRLRLADADAELATHDARIGSLRARIERYQTAVDEVMQIEAEQKQLNRDYDILRGNHSQLTSRMEQARLTREVDTSVDTVRFRTLDPPKVPSEPVGPNRVAMSSTVFGGSLISGFALAFLLAQMRPVFFDRRQLAEVTGVPVIGSINMISTPRQRMRERISSLAFTLVLVGLIAGFGLVLTVFLLRIDVISRLPF